MAIGEKPVIAVHYTLVIEQLKQGFFGYGHIGRFTFYQQPGFVVAVINDYVKTLIEVAYFDIFFYRH